MGIPELHHDETVIYHAHNIKVKSVVHDAVLTNQRLILIDSKKGLLPPQEILIATISTVESGENAIRDPILTFSIFSKGGIARQVILTFPRESGGERWRERNDWFKVLKEYLPSPENTPVIPGVTVIDQGTPPRSGINHLTFPGNAGSPPQKNKIEITRPKNNNIGSVSTKPQHVKTTSLPIGLFCSRCGNHVPPESAFCDKCGTKIIYPVQPAPPKQSDDIYQDEVRTPEISMGQIELPSKKISFSYTNDSYNKEKVPVTALLHKEPGEKKTFFARSDKRKPAVIAVLGLIGFIVLIAVFFVLVPSGSPGFNLTSPGMNFTIPEFNFTALAINPFVNTTNISNTPSTPAIPEQTRIPEVTSAKPAFTPVSGDPTEVLVAYTPLFNNGNGAGLHALLSENIKLQYPVEALNSELATALSNGYIIDKILVKNQNIIGNVAILEVDISWNLVGSPITSTQNLPLVYENNQWKLDTLILSP